MQVNFEQSQGRPEVLIGRLSGAINALAADQLWESASQQVDQDAHFVVFDFTEVTMLTSAGIGILVRLYTRLKDRNGGLAVFGCSGKIREIFSIVMLDKVLKVCDSEDQAWEAIKQAHETATS
jgi:anti-sigma B factor antagonist